MNSCCKVPIFPRKFDGVISKMYRGTMPVNVPLATPAKNLPINKDSYDFMNLATIIRIAAIIT